MEPKSTFLSFIAAALLSLVSVPSCVYAQNSDKTANPSGVPTPLRDTVTVILHWQTTDGKTVKKSFSAIDISQIAGKGLWLAFQTENNEHFPGIYMSGAFNKLNTPMSRMTALWLEIILNTKTGDRHHSCMIFDKDRAFGSKLAAPENVYHVLVLTGFLDGTTQSDGLNPESLPNKEWAAPFQRIHMLAYNYAMQSDAKAREYMKLFDVETQYALPRLIMAAEEWLDIPKEVVEKKKKAAGGWGVLSGLGDKIDAEKKVVPQMIPTYSLDVLNDTLEAKGRYAVGFQASRSMWNDVLESKVLYEATGRKRRIITASIVFSQMQKNIAERKSDNRVLRVQAGNVKLLGSCVHLWPDVKKQIESFLSDHPEWQVHIPVKPVTFYQDGKPIYAMYAWFQVHPDSGRMIGVLPDGAHGGKTDELLKLAGGLMDKLQDKGMEKIGADKNLFSQIAGLYVGAAGIIDGIAMTIADPSLAALDRNEWLKFLALHALDHAEKFLEENAEQYDSYGALVGFWQGAMIWPMELVRQGGSGKDVKDVLEEAARKASKSIWNKVEKDVKAFAEDKIKEGKQLANEALNEALEKHEPELRTALEGIQKVREHYDTMAEGAKEVDEAINRFREAMNDQN